MTCVIPDPAFARSLQLNRTLQTGEWRSRAEGVVLVDERGRIYIAKGCRDLVVLQRYNSLRGDGSTGSGVAAIETGKVSSGRRLNIPKSVAEALGVAPGDRLKLVESRVGLAVFVKSPDGDVTVEDAGGRPRILLPQGCFADGDLVKVEAREGKLVVEKCSYYVMAAVATGDSLLVRIPADLVRELGWKPGKVKVYRKGDKVVVEPLEEP